MALIFRKSDKNIGCDWRQVPTRLHQLLGNAQYWIAEKVFPVDEIGARFHHQLVLIHVFPNGNGRHARMMTDCLLRHCGAKPFSWGHGSLIEASALRNQYLAALRAADAGDLKALLQFVRS